MQRMTDERLAEIGKAKKIFAKAYWREMATLIQELYQALKAERERIEELEAENEKYSAGMQENCSLRKRIAQLEAEKQSLFTAAKHHLLENKKLQARLKRWGKTRWK